MIIKTHRFGSIEIGSEDIISFPGGIIGFPDETQFVLLRNERSDIIGWLQSATNPAFALPVVSAHCLVEEYPDVPMEDMVRQAGLGGDTTQLAVLVVLCASAGQPATVNLLAPVLIDAESRTGAQVILEETKFTTRELFVVPGVVPEPPRRTAQQTVPATQG